MLKKTVVVNDEIKCFHFEYKNRTSQWFNYIFHLNFILKRFLLNERTILVYFSRVTNFAWCFGRFYYHIRSKYFKWPEGFALDCQFI